MSAHHRRRGIPPVLIVAAYAVATVTALQLTIIEQTLHTRHRPPPGQPHAESPDRLFAAGDALRAAFGISEAQPEGTPFEGNSNPVSWRRAVDSKRTSPEGAVAALKLVHDVEHLRTVSGMSSSGGGGFDTDTYCAPGSWEAMLDGTRAWVDAVGLAAAGEGPAFALCRPAGHHATRRVAMGFGLVNFAAAAAAAALEPPPLLSSGEAEAEGAAAAAAAGRGGGGGGGGGGGRGGGGGGAPAAERVAILDWDVHHGNGVAAIFADNPQVRYCSLHEAGGFPGSGADESDGGPGGNVLNLPLPKGSGSEDYLTALKEKALPFLLGSDGADGEAPTVLLVCAGYDAMKADPLATMTLGPGDFRASVELITKDFGFPATRIALGLEGGYSLDPEVGMPAGVVATCEALLSLDSRAQ